MKRLSTFILACIGVPMLAMAQANAPSFNFGVQEMLWLVLVLMGILLLFLVMIMNRLANILKSQVLGEEAASKELSLWDKFVALRSDKTEEELTMDHQYDGISELDNPTPPWFNFLFYGTIVFSIVYLIQYHVIGEGNIMEQEYAAEMKQAEEMKKVNLANQANAVDETTVTLVSDKAILAEAAITFKAKCAACHGELGEGKNGPNLTDEYWIHGGTIQEVFKSIKYGIPQKGMIPWQNLMKPEEMQNMASYVISIQGSLPPGTGKAPEGNKMDNTEQPKPEEDNQSTALINQ